MSHHDIRRRGGGGRSSLGPCPALGQPVSGWTAPRAPDGHPDLQGVWNFSTLTPLERPDEFAGKPLLTEAEAAEYVQQRIRNANADRRDGKGTERRPGEDTDVARAYNDFWYDRGTTVVGTRRTSLIVDPPDGKLPPLTLEGQRRATALATFRKEGVRGPLDSAKTRPVRERCIWWESEGLPLAPMGAYNANFQLVQNQDHVVMRHGNDSRCAHHPSTVVPIFRRRFATYWETLVANGKE